MKRGQDPLMEASGQLKGQLARVDAGRQSAVARLQEAIESGRGLAECQTRHCEMEGRHDSDEDGDEEEVVCAVGEGREAAPERRRGDGHDAELFQYRMIGSLSEPSHSFLIREVEKPSIDKILLSGCLASRKPISNDMYPRFRRLTGGILLFSSIMYLWMWFFIYSASRFQWPSFTIYSALSVQFEDQGGDCQSEGCSRVDFRSRGRLRGARSIIVIAESHFVASDGGG
jgi:hypothetical protein